MQDRLRTSRRKQLRASILTMLYANDTAPISIKTMELALLSSYPNIRADLNAVVKYLQSKGYVEIIKGDETGPIPMRDDSLALTAHGTDLIEETIPDDPGVVFGDGDRT